MNDLPRPFEPTPREAAGASRGPACTAGASWCGMAPLRAWGALAALLLTVPFVASQLLGDPSTPAEEPAVAAEAELLPNALTPQPGLLTGGAPATPAGFAALAAAGYRTYVDLRTISEAGPEAEQAAAAAGLTYVRIPVAGEIDLDLATVRALDAILAEPASAPLALACSSGNRSGALLALRAFWLEGASPTAALELGKRGGLTRLEPTVRTLLGLPEPTTP
jgi:protein tyrosine phosphatase (PTP) superfamily phosphohydrolase (DUF442 family)